ncbi:heterogeneous nuclear ribonucleoprotein A3-like [Helianthus annuus]|uniref:heterogeneous nuclear ribonucleoprotein A3-like n=1 Tax=Helianthus annuus TaxID=4232 RepID=UPI000B8FAA47|nr:heterogeneous nuclear ribonucleoprotein A3-like [Helianthus annuus]
MDGPKIAEYVQRFHDLSRVVPYMVKPEFKRVERFIWGLAPQIMSMVTTSKPATITEAIDLSVALIEEAIRKFSNFKKGTSSANKKKETNPPAEVKSGAENKGKGYMGTLPKCDVCQYHHVGQCRVRKCESCGKVGHSKETRWAGTGRGGQRGYGNGNNSRGGNGYGNRPQGGNGGNDSRGNFGNQAGSGNRGANNNPGGNGNGNGRGPGYFNCGDVGHFKRECPKINQAQGRVFNIGDREARQDPNVVTAVYP